MRTDAQTPGHIPNRIPYRDLVHRILLYIIVVISRAPGRLPCLKVRTQSVCKFSETSVGLESERLGRVDRCWHQTYPMSDVA